MTYLLFSGLLIYLLSNYNKGSILILIILPLLEQIPIGSFSVANILVVIIVLLWLVKSNHKIFEIKNSVFTYGILFMSMSLVLSNIHGAVKHTPTVYLSIIQLLSIYVMIDCLNNKTLTNFSIKIITSLSMIFSINGIIETITHSNPLLNFGINIGLISNDIPIIEEVRFGFKRVQSVFDMHTSWGGYTLLSFCLVFFIIKYKGYIIKHPFFLLSIIGANCFLTGARSAILGFVISFIAFINFDDLIERKNKKIICILLILSFLFLDYFQTIISSFQNTDNVDGSNVDMRENQFEICFFHFLKSPIYGNGISYTWEFALPMDKNLNGAESLWIPILIDQGIIGVIAIVTMYLLAAVYLYKTGNTKFIFVLLGFLVFNTLSSIPHFSIINLIYYIIILASCHINDEKYDCSISYNK